MKAIFTFALLAVAHIGFCQGFVNLAFESTTITTIHNPGGDSYTATTPGWSVNAFNYVNGDPNSIPFNSIALDAPSVNLEGTNSIMPLIQPIQGKYSIFMQGGTIHVSETNGASIWQTAQVPIGSQTLTYWGDTLQATFNGQFLSFVAISNTPNYTIWGASISAYAGLTGTLAFTAPWQKSGFLDNIQFSASPVPEPSVLGLFALGGAFLAFRRWKK